MNYSYSQVFLGSKGRVNHTCTLCWNNVRDVLFQLLGRFFKKMEEMAPVTFHYSRYVFLKNAFTISADKAISQTAPVSSWFSRPPGSEDRRRDVWEMYAYSDLIGFFSQVTWAVLFAGVIKLLITATTQLLLRALIIPSAAKAADVMLLRTGFIINIQ